MNGTNRAQLTYGRFPGLRFDQIVLVFAGYVFCSAVAVATPPERQVSAGATAGLSQLRTAVSAQDLDGLTGSSVIVFQNDGDLWWVSPANAERHRITKVGDIWGHSISDEGTIVVGRSDKLYLLTAPGSYKLVADAVYGNPPLMSRRGDFIIAAKKAIGEPLPDREDMKMVSERGDSQYRLVRIDLRSGKETLLVGLDNIAWPKSIKQVPDYNERQWWGSFPDMLAPNDRQLLFSRAHMIIESGGCNPWVRWRLDLSEEHSRPQALLNQAGTLECIGVTDWRGNFLLYDYYGDPRGMYIYDLSADRSYMLRSGYVGSGTFSPDGGKVLYMDWTDEPKAALVLIDITPGTEVTLRKFDDFGYPSSWLWSPDSHYAVDTGGHELLAMDLIARRLIQLGPGMSPLWVKAKYVLPYTSSQGKK